MDHNMKPDNLPIQLDIVVSQARYCPVCCIDTSVSKKDEDRPSVSSRKQVNGV